MLERLRAQPLEQPDKLAGFFYQIAINLQIAEVRKSVRRKTQPDEELIARLADPSQNPLRTLCQQRAGSAVRVLIAALDNPRDRRLLHGFYIEEREKDELCTELNLSQRHFDKVLFRAKQRFKELVLGE